MVFCSLIVDAQNTINSKIHNHSRCGTEPTIEQIRHMDETREERQTFDLEMMRAGGPLYIPVQNHIVRKDDGTGGLTTSQINDIMDELNDYYGDANMHFFQCGTINYINDTDYYNFHQDEENEISANDKSNVINIYYFNTVTSVDNTSLCGYARFPPSDDRVIMKNSCATNGSTIVHEIGHYFSLYHTHGKSNCGTTDELVDGSNCSNKGDDVCDTPADPNLYFDCDQSLVSNCSYTGGTNYTDANGDAYSPDVNNIMSYAPKSCRTNLTSGQLARAAFSALNDRNYLHCCSFNLTIPNVVLSGVYQANNNITTSGTTNVPSNSNVTFRAANSITLNANFTVPLGSTFTAEIGNCQSPAARLSPSEFPSDDLLVTKEKEEVQEKIKEENPLALGHKDIRVYPNPFSGITTIDFEIPESQDVLVTITNLQGQTVATLANGKLEAGNHKYTFDATDLPNGMYYCTFITQNNRVTKTMVLAR